MVLHNQRQIITILGICSLSLLALSCGDTSTPGSSQPGTEVTSQQPQPGNQADNKPAATKRKFAPVKLGGDSHSHAGHAHKHTSPQTSTVLKAMQPLQIMLGTWQGKTFRSRIVDDVEWIWDFKTDSNQPALVMTTNDKNPLLSNARLTFLAKQQKYQLSITDDNNDTRILSGDFIVPVVDIPGDNKKLQRTYKLELTQTTPADAKEKLQIVFNQQENNRYLVEFSRKRGNAKFHKFETIASQRQGTSFASIDPDDYGEKTCIITEGLGTISVSYKGKSYWVCCTGCKAAFEDDPETWLAKLAERKMKK